MKWPIKGGIIGGSMGSHGSLPSPNEDLNRAV